MLKDEEAWEHRACRGASPKAHHEWAWNDDKGRPGADLAAALDMCKTCPSAARHRCAEMGRTEKLGIWGGQTPPERRGELPISPFMRESLLAADFTQGKPVLDDAATVEELDAAYKSGWESAAQAHGSYMAVPFEVAHRLSEEHRLAHCARLGLDGNHRPLREEDDETKNRASEPVPVKRRPAGKGIKSGVQCVNGHDLRGQTEDGRSVLSLPKSGRPVCRLCKREASARHAAKTTAS